MAAALRIPLYIASARFVSVDAADCASSKSCWVVDMARKERDKRDRVWVDVNSEGDASET